VPEGLNLFGENDGHQGEQKCRHKGQTNNDHWQKDRGRLKQLVHAFRQLQKDTVNVVEQLEKENEYLFEFLGYFQT
jgi:hypothetical protein